MKDLVCHSMEQHWDKHISVVYNYMLKDKWVGTITMQIYDGSYQILSFYILPEHRNNTLGSHIFNEFLNTYKHVDIELKVHKDNIIAKNMYEKRGFIFYADCVDPEYIFLIKRK